MRVAGDLLFYATFIGYVVFCVLFFWSHWWRTAIGRHIFAFMAVPAVLMGLGVLYRFTLWVTGSTAWFDERRDLFVFWSYLAMAIVVWWRVVILIVAQRFDPEATMVRDDQRVVVEGKNQRVTIEGSGDTNPDALGEKEPSFD